MTSLDMLQTSYQRFKEFEEFEEFSECFDHFENWLVALGAFYRAILDSILLSLVYDHFAGDNFSLKFITYDLSVGSTETKYLHKTK